MKKTIYILLFSFLFAGILNAQHYYKKYPFKPELVLGLHTGLNYYIGEHFKDYIPSLTALGFQGKGSIAYHFTPVWGVRTFFGMANMNWPDDESIVNLRAPNLTVDITCNLSNAYNYIEDRKTNLIIFAGTGISNPSADNTEGYDSHIYIPIRGGLQSDIKLTENLELNIIAEINVVGDSYNGNPAVGTSNTPFDLIPGFSLGISYHIATTKRILLKKRAEQ